MSICLDALKDALERLSYHVEWGVNSLIIDADIPIVCTCDGNKITLCSEVGNLSEIKGKDLNPENLNVVLLGLLDLNTVITPYAVGVIGDHDDDGGNDWPIVISDSFECVDEFAVGSLVARNVTSMKSAQATVKDFLGGTTHGSL